MNKENLVDSFKDYQNQVREGILKSHEHYDKTLTLISSGGLALSMAFVEKLGGANPLFPGFLVATWVLLGLTLLLSLTSFLLSIRYHINVEQSFGKLMEKYLSINWEAKEEEIRKMPLPDLFKEFEKFETDSDKLNEMNQEHFELVERYSKKLDILTYAPYFTLIIGICLLIFFASMNILNNSPKC